MSQITFQCTFCDKSFKTSCKLNYHMNQHTNKKPFKCDLCNKPFESPIKLKSHKLAHKSPVVCDICNKQYLNLYDHKQKFHSSTSHKCEICFKTFKHSCYLKKHQYIHPGEKLYPCSYCGANFNTSGNRISVQEL